MTSSQFQVINPKGNSVSRSKNCLDAWVQYYNRRNDVLIEKWEHNVKNIQHPIQSSSDSYNCGDFTCCFIEQYVKHTEQINFKSSRKDLAALRNHIASTLDSNKSE